MAGDDCQRQSCDLPKSCGLCGHLSVPLEYGGKGSPEPGYVYLCDAPDHLFGRQFSDDWWKYKGYRHPDEGKDCPAWAAIGLVP